MRKKVMSMILAGILLGSLSAGCGVKEGPSSEQVSDTGETKQDDTGEWEEITVTRLWNIESNMAPNHEPLNRLMKEKFNIHVEWSDINSSAYKEQLNLLLSTGELPDMFYFNGEADIKRYAAQGYLLPISDYFDKLPNYRALYTDEEWNEMLTYASSPDGKLYYLPNKNYRSASRSWIYRMGMLEELERPVPSTTEELYDLLKAYKAAYPESIPMANRWGISGLLNGFSLAYRTNTGFFYDPDSGQLEYGPVTDKFRDMLEYVARLYEEKLIDPEFQTATDTQWEEVYANGLNIAEYSYTNRAAWANNVMKGADPDADWQWTDRYLTAYPDKGELVPREQGYQQLGTCLTKALEGERLERVLEFLDWSVSEEGQRWFSCGEEGVTYELVDGKPVFLPDVYSMDHPEGKDIEEFGYGYFVIRAEESLEQLGYADDLKLSAAIADKEYLKRVAYNLSEEQEKSLIDAEMQVNDVYEEYVLRFITGSLDPSDDGDWKDFQDKIKKAGLEDILQTRRSVMIVDQ